MPTPIKTPVQMHEWLKKQLEAHKEQKKKGKDNPADFWYHHGAIEQILETEVYLCGMSIGDHEGS